MNTTPCPRCAEPRRAGVAIAAVVLLAAGCSAPSPRDDVIDVLRAQQAAWNAGDLDAFLVGYEASEATTFASASGLIRGLDQVRERYRARYPDRAAMGELTFSELEVTPLGSDAAYVIGHWRLARESDAPEGVFTVVFRKTTSGWKIVHDHTSAAPSADEPGANG